MGHSKKEELDDEEEDNDDDDEENDDNVESDRDRDCVDADKCNLPETVIVANYEIYHVIVYTAGLIHFLIPLSLIV